MKYIPGENLYDKNTGYVMTYVGELEQNNQIFHFASFEGMISQIDITAFSIPDSATYDFHDHAYNLLTVFDDLTELEDYPNVFHIAVFNLMDGRRTHAFSHVGTIKALSAKLNTFVDEYTNFFDDKERKFYFLPNPRKYKTAKSHTSSQSLPKKTLDS